MKAIEVNREIQNYYYLFIFPMQWMYTNNFVFTGFINTQNFFQRCPTIVVPYKHC